MTTSLLTAIPKDNLKIINSFLIEKRVQCPLICSYSKIMNLQITKHKDGYKIDVVFIVLEEEDEEQKIERRKPFERDSKYYPIYIDEINDVIDYMIIKIFGDEEEDYIDENHNELRLGGLNDYYFSYDMYKKQIKKFLLLVGKVYTTK